MKPFKLILEGPPGSGKTTFLNELLHLYKVKLSWRERYTFKQTGDHEFLIQAASKPFPEDTS